MMNISGAHNILQTSRAAQPGLAETAWAAARARSISPDEESSASCKENRSESATPDASGSGLQVPDPTPSLFSAEQEQIRELKKADRETRAHEQAHMAAGGPYVRGGPRYGYTTGPDGRQYATSGSVSIDASPVPGDPAATIQKAQAVKRAALAPARPSAADRQVAAQAASMEAKARTELARERNGLVERAGKMRTDESPATGGRGVYQQAIRPPEDEEQGRLSLYV